MAEWTKDDVKDAEVTRRDTTKAADTKAKKAATAEDEAAQKAADDLEFGSGKQKPEPVPVDEEHASGSTVPV
jgi:hypothetical protein